jgi:predicted GNAT superfamily acetyltransferase
MRLQRPHRLVFSFSAAQAIILNPSSLVDGISAPYSGNISFPGENEALLLVEIPSNFATLKVAAPALALQWRLHCREVFQLAFTSGYIVTDFIRENNAGTAAQPGRCFYVLSHGESTL